MTVYSLQERPIAWKIRHSAWLLAVVLGFGSFSCIGFIYCAVRVRSAAWTRRAVVTTILSLTAFILLSLPSESAQGFGAGYAAILWFALMAYGAFIDRDYLRWRSAQTPLSPPPRREMPSPPAAPPGSPTAQAAPAAVPVAPEPPAPVVSPMTTSGHASPSASEAPRAPQAPVASRAAFESPVPDPVAELDAGFLVSSWQEAEALAAWHMQRLGFADAAITPPGADGGLDVRSTDAVAQVKHYATSIGAPVIQQLRGAAHGEGAALFYSLSGYTRAAVEFADNAAVALFTYNESGEVQPLNPTARILHDRAGGDEVFDPSEFESQVEMVAVLQQYFDLMNSTFLESAHRALAAADGDRNSPIFRSLVVERDRVEAILRSIDANGGRVSSDRLIEASSAIGEAAMRLAADLERP